jgi:hypothetical protein
MGISPINWLAGVGFGLVFLAVVVRRWATQRGELESQIGWAFGGGFGAAGLVKGAYPIYLFVRYKSIEGIDDLWLYVYAGSLAALFLSLAIIVRSWKVA